ncbi:MAG: DNA-processing protein DprA [Syntrophales bacterium]|nr:DNA-processing protein DprA [Syntrophales bacterium]
MLKYLLALKKIEGLGNLSIRTLIDNFHDPERIFNAHFEELIQVPDIGEKIASKILSFQGWNSIDKELSLLEKLGVNVIPYWDENYPELLKNIYDYPAFLYVKGQLMKEDICIAIVGSRQASAYGKFTTEKIARELALQGITIVSGMARGIDSAAHYGALSVNCRTIAVLGSGIDVIYPPENKDLYNKITEFGAVISEYPPGTPPIAAHFPARNRIISGLSYGVVVVEASDKSGSLITARFALEQGREVFAVPGAIDHPGSRGTNKLIKQGAKLVQNIDDIIDEISPMIKEHPALRKKTDVDQKGELKELPADLSEVEKMVMLLLSNEHPLPVDTVIQKSGFRANEILNALLILELKGLVKQLPGKRYVRDH